MLSDASFDIDSKIAEDDYRDILQFVNINNRITYSRFDVAVLRQVNLFALPEDFDFDGVQKTLDTIIKALPAIKRIVGLFKEKPSSFASFSLSICL